MTPRPFLTLAAALLLPLPAVAADCLGLGPAGSPATLQEVDVRARPIPLLRNASERAGCPADTPECRTGGSLSSGNRVVVGATEGAFACASHADPRGPATWGWVQTDALVPVPEAETTPADWVGRYRGSESRRVRVTADRDGVVTLRSDPPGGGAFTARFRPDGARAAFVLAADGTAGPDAPGEATRCRVTLQQRGAYLIVQDNDRCGGLTGLYRRRR